jgi:hypothetical protein
MVSESPGTKIIMAEIMLSPTFNSGKTTKSNRQ